MTAGSTPADALLTIRAQRLAPELAGSLLAGDDDAGGAVVDL
jgi:hypothetical protein